MPNYKRRRTPEMVKFVKRWYPSKGGKWCAKKLGVPPHVAHNIARDYDLLVGRTVDVRTGKRVLIGDMLLEMPGASDSAIRSAAWREGVLQSIKVGKRFYTSVPSKWAKARISEWQQAHENEREYRHYLTAKEAAKKLGLHTSTLTKFAIGKSKRMAKILGDVHVVKGACVHGGPRRWLFEPKAIDAARIVLEEERHKASYWMTVKGLALECGVKPNDVKYILKRMGEQMEVFVIGSVRVAHVAPHVANKVREHYGVRQAA